MGYSTISWLGFIIKQKPEGIKRRIILDLRRSGGNKKAQLRKKWCCHAPRTQCRWCATTIQPATEPRCVGARRHWHSDAFMSLAVRECELPHTLAPEVQPDDFILFCALLFGYKTAPLLWSRLAACLASDVSRRRSATPSILGRWAVGVARDAQRVQLHAGFDSGIDGRAWL